jgi:hypothetical protein
MLFDLRGRRRRAVQAVYLTLALLMGGGLVLFGIGGDVSGGLVDAFKGGGGSNGDSVLEDRVSRQEERLAANPQNEAVLQNLIRDYYSLATGQQQDGATGFPEEARDDLRKAGTYWERYADTVDGDPSADTAQYALRIYAPEALNRPQEMQRAAQIIAADANNVASYLVLVEAAALAGDNRTADLAANKAVELAPKADRKAVKEQAEALKKPPTEQQPGR